MIGKCSIHSSTPTFSSAKYETVDQGGWWWYFVVCYIFLNNCATNWRPSRDRGKTKINI